MPASTSEQQARAAAVDGVGLLADDRVRDRRILDAEGAAETAAHVVALERLEGESGHLVEQGARLVMDAELAQAGATVVVGEAGVELHIGGRKVHHVHQEAHEFVSAFAEPAGAFCPGGIVRQGLGVVRPRHADAGAGRRDDVVVALEGLDEMAGEHCRVGGVAAVESRLAAAGLRVRYLDTASGIAQQLERGEADAGAHRIDQAGDEEADTRWRREGTYLFEGSGHSRTLHTFDQNPAQS